MSETKWTPGPWQVWTNYNEHDGRGCNIFSEDLRQIALDVDTANAHLIAAAPDLYEALGSISAEAMKAMTVGGTNLAVAHEKARLALSKARGETS